MRSRSNFFFGILFIFIAGLTFAFNQKNNHAAYKKYDPQALVRPVYTEKQYEKLWERVDSLQGKGLYASGLELCDKILKDASAQNIPTQVVKAIMYKMKFASYIKEEDYVSSIAELEKISAAAKHPLKQIIHSVTAQVYYGYYQRNRWKFYNRSTTVEFKNEDISTWDLKTLSEKVIYEYGASLSEPHLSKSISIESFKYILQDYYAEGVRLRPTLYDFLNWRAYEFFAYNEFEVIRPADKFTTNDINYLMPRKTFLAQKIQSVDTFSCKLYATQIIADLIRFHLDDKDPYAMVHCDLARLNFMRANSALSEKDSIYNETLKALANDVSAHESWAEVQNYLISYVCEQAAKFNPDLGNAHKWDYKTALVMCDEATKKFPKSYGAGLCEAQKATIESKSISFQVQDCVIPDKPSVALITSRNVKKAWFRVIHVGWDFDETYDYYDDTKFIKKLLAYKPVKTVELDLQDDNDYQPHKLDFAMSALPSGAYYVLSSATPDFKITQNNIGYTPMNVSNIAYISTKEPETEKYQFYILNRDNGKPISGAKFTMVINEYDSKSYRYHRRRGQTLTSDAEGKVTIEATNKDYRYFYVDITNGNDRFVSDRQHYQYRPYQRDKYEYITTYFFTDRKIYRPGQTIHFKGIQISTMEGREPQLVTNNPATVVFNDVNYQKVADLQVTTNEFGSFSGTFTAPQGVLTGQMHLTDGHGTYYFSVEEYKRPKFEVDFKPVDGTYRLNDTISSQGFAKSYSGAMVDGAEVNYRVVRSVNYWHWWWWWGPQPYGTPTEILNGKTTTDEKGEFKIKFNAVPDKTTNPKHLPVFSYTVYADVTDINGETRSSTQNINAGYHTMQISIGVPGEMDRNGSNIVTLSTTNLNYNKVPAQGRFKITRLIPPANLMVDRKLEKADRHALSLEEFKKQFPYDIYTDENNYEKWQRTRILFQVDFDTQKSDSITLEGLKNWEPGMYIAEAFSKDKWGQDVKEQTYFTIYDLASTKLPSPQEFYIKALQTTNEPGETAKFLIGSSYPGVYAMLEWEGKDGILKKEVLELNNEVKTVSFPIEEKHRGNIMLNVNFIYNNRFYTRKEYITVPYTNKQLDIEFETFRNKLYPGQDEEWKIKIKGKKGDKIAAEMLLTMYDASLDAFAANYFYLNVYNAVYSNRYFECSDGFSIRGSTAFERDFNRYVSSPYRYIYSLNWFGFYPSNYYYRYNDGDDYASGGKSYEREETKHSAKKADLAAAEAVPMDGNLPPPPPPPAGSKDNKNMDHDSRNRPTTVDQTDSAIAINGKEQSGEFDKRGGELANVKARTNLGETAFFFPHLETNEAGDVIVKFKMPESLTKWKILGLGHTKDLKTGTLTAELVTQKDLMIVPNMPRFLRESDKMTIATKITNISDGDLEGNTQLVLLDAFTQKPIEDKFQLKNAIQSFKVKGKQSTSVSWDIAVPFGYEAVTWRIVAKAKNFSDGEEAALPVLSNRMMVTESMPLHIRKKGSKEFNFTKLIESAKSSTLKNYKLTLEYCSNPAWYGIQSLPYLMEYPHECAEQTFARFYANSIAYNIANSNPKIKAVFDAWKNTSPESFLSNLEKNQELKAVVLEETPWVLDAKDESERKKRVGLLFDFNKMADELERAIKKLEKMQAANGGFPWFPGMEESRYITQHIVTGMGHLDKLGVKKIREDEKVWRMVKKAVDYLDYYFLKDYRDLKRYNKNYLKEQTIGYYQVQYLYARSYFRDLKVSGETKEAVDYYIKQEQKYWLEFNLFSEAMIALTLNRYDDKKTTADVVKSLRERSIYNEEMGRYWKENTAGYYWYEAPIETQAILIECFDEAANDQEMVEDLKVWLLKNKQTNAWQTTKATTEACYALLLRGSDWLANDEMVEVEMGGKVIDPKAMGVKTEAGTGYYKMNWNGEEIKPEMGKIKLTSTTNSVSWGALHWQYFEDLDKITGHETPIKLKKELFVVENTPAGPVIRPIGKTKLNVGDKVRVRVELRLDRQMEFVHMKDMRAAGFEPINVLSQYKYQDGLGYYESTRDAATHFFFDNIGKGTYVFEYDLRVSHAGDFSNGIAQIQCMYAPEFNSHSDGLRVAVVK
jgi:uncharacterized protein YfaS (alpha-2-macroglobulin family)